MKVSFDHFSPNAVERERYKEGVDYLTHKFDLEFDDTLYLLKELKNDRGTLRTYQQPIKSGTLTQERTILSTGRMHLRGGQLEQDE